jgi:Zn-dependent metalloprotease
LNTRRISRLGQLLLTFVFVLSISLQGIHRAAAQDRGGVRVRHNPHTGKVSFIGADPAHPITVRGALAPGLVGNDRAMAMVRPYAADFGLKQPDRELKVKKAEKTNGRQVTNYQQTYQDVPVMAGELVVNATDDGGLVSINGEISPDLSLDTVPAVTAVQATTTALGLVAKWYRSSPADFDVSEPALWIYDSQLLQPDGTAPSLAWRMDVTAKDKSKLVRELVLVDAQRGEITLHFNQDDTAWGSHSPVSSEGEHSIEAAAIQPAAIVAPTDTDPVQAVSADVLTGVSRYVATSGADVGDCTNSASPCLTMNYAISPASAGDTIKVASGTYTGSGTDPVVTIATAVALSGGWDSGFTTQTGFSIVDGQDERRGAFVNAPSGTVTISRFIVQNGHVSGAGGGIRAYTPLLLENCKVRNNTATGELGNPVPMGAAIYASTLTIVQCIITDNTALSSRNDAAVAGGAIYDTGNLIISDSYISNNHLESVGTAGDAFGGGIYANQSLVMDGSTVSDNSVSAGIYADAYGGGIYAFGSTLSIRNSTISRNSVHAGVQALGGGLYDQTSITGINNSTIIRNQASRWSGIFVSGYPAPTVKNTILAYNTVPSGYECPFSSGWFMDHNLIDNIVRCSAPLPANNTVADPALLASSVGMPPFYALTANSPAINSGNPASCLTTDQRGVARTYGTACDIGAVEFTGNGSTPVYVLPYQGADQYIHVGLAAGVDPAAVVVDAAGAPVAGVQVSFTAPTAGPRGTFSNGTNQISATTNSHGIADAGPFISGTIEGSYAVTATVSGLSSPALFTFLNGRQDVRTYNMDYRIPFNMIPGVLICDLSQKGCTGGADPDADAAQSFSYGTALFYRDHFQRNSLDNAGLPIISSVHYGYGLDYNNASWNGTEVVYGDGFSRADDVVAHELSHGVTQYTSNLLYYYQAGAINESLSDVFGELYDQSNGLGNDAPEAKWLLGEDLPVFGASRSMSDPGAYGDPDSMLSSNYYLGDADNGGVHTNSGVNNKAAALLVDGGTFNTKSVTALGADKTLAIYYEVNTHLLTSGSDFADLSAYLYQACLNLVGTSVGIVDSDCESVQNAVDAVAMNAQPPSAPSYNTEAPVCSSGLSPADIFHDDFESGLGNWSFLAAKGKQRWQLDSSYGPFAHSGTQFLYADDAPAAITDVSVKMKTGVKLPANAYLHFAQAYDFDRYPLYQLWFDGGVLEYSIDNGSTWHDTASMMLENGYRGKIISGTGNPLSNRNAFVGTSHGYISTRLNLSSLAGKTVKFRWRMGLDHSYYVWGWWLDDVRIYTCGASGKLQPASGAANIEPAVTLSWKPMSGATSYEYCYSTTEGSCSQWLKRGMSTSASISGLSPDTTYYWQVRASILGAPVYADPTWCSFTTAPLPASFTKFPPLGDAANQPLTPLLSWNASSPVTGYEYCYDTSDDDACDGAWTPTTQTSAALSGLSLDTTYYWQVRALNSFGATSADDDAWASFKTTPTVFTISGNVGVGGASLAYTDGSMVTVAADSSGNYSLSASPNWSGTVTPSKPGYGFVPENTMYSPVNENQPAQNYVAHAVTTQTFQSRAAQDGWLLESTEYSGKGGTANAGATTFRLGDDPKRKQYVSILSFVTSPLPDAAMITKVTLKLTRQSIVGGGDPFSTLNGLLIDTKGGFFGSAAGLQLADFQAPAGLSGTVPSNPTVNGASYSMDLEKGAGSYVNLTTAGGGLTQLRLHFQLDDNNNALANYISFWSGNSTAVANRPTLVVTYYLP